MQITLSPSSPQWAHGSRCVKLRRAGVRATALGFRRRISPWTRHHHAAVLASGSDEYRDPEPHDGQRGVPGLKQKPAVGSLSWGTTAFSMTQINPMKKLPVFSLARFREQYRRRRLHAALRQLPVYEFERLAFTEAGCVPSAIKSENTKLRPSRLRIHYRWLRLHYGWRQLFLL